MEKIINQNNNMTTEAAMEESMRENTTEIEETTTAEESVLTAEVSTEADESTTLAEAATTTEEPTSPAETTDVDESTPSTEPTPSAESDTPMQDSGFMKRLEIINISDNKTEMEKKLGVKASYVIEKNTNGEASKFYIQITSLRIQNLSKRYSAKEYMRPKKIMEEFLGYGHPLDKDTLIALIRHMIDNINDYVNGSFHPTLGWTTHNGSDMLLLDRAISNDPSYQSVYEGPLKDKIGPGPETDPDRYREELCRLYNDKPKMQLIYSVGLTGIIRQLLRVSDTSFMLSVCGEKGAGKTTSERGALSAWGNPEDLLSSFNASGVAIDDRYRERLIIPNIIDEGLGKGNDKSNKVKDYIRSLIFGSASGKTREISKRAAVTHFCPTIISTENPLAEILSLSNSDGEFERLFEICIVKGDLTADAEEAEYMDEFFSQNYGVGAYELGRYMVENGINRSVLKGYYDRRHKDLCDLYRDQPEVTRALKRIAVIGVTAELVSNAMNLGWNADLIEKILVDSFFISIKYRDEKKYTYARLVDIVKNNYKCFGSEITTYNTKEELGIVQMNAYKNLTVYVEYTKVCAIINGVDVDGLKTGDYSSATSEKGKSDISAILKYWSEQGWLDSEKDRYTSSRKVKRKSEIEEETKESVSFCVIKIDKKLLIDDSPEQEEAAAA